MTMNVRSVFVLFVDAGHDLQNDNGCSTFYAAAALSDGSILVAGSEFDESGGYDFVAFKLDTSGDILCKWKEGSAGVDVMMGAAAGSDGSVVLSGQTDGTWNETSRGEHDGAAVKLDSNGDVVWRLQVGTAGSDGFYSVAIGQDDSAVLGGFASNDFYLVKVDADGVVLWEWSRGSSGQDVGYGVAMAGDDGSVVLAGWTSGDWSGRNVGQSDFAAVKVDADGQEIWWWQDGTLFYDELYCLVANEDGSTILGGMIHNLDWASVVLLRLGADGTLLWSWESGMFTYGAALDLALEDDGSVMFAGYTYGNWSGVNQGDSDFMAGKLNATDGSLQPWRWQDGTSTGDVIRAIAPGGSDGSMALVGRTFGSFGTSNVDEQFQGVVVMLTSSPSTIEPSPAPVRAPTIAPMPPPTPAPERESTSAPVSLATPSPHESTIAPMPPPTPAPERESTSAPVSLATPSPHESTIAPMPPPTPAPERESTSAPVSLATPSPHESTSAPVSLPTPAPVRPSTSAPVSPPTPAPTRGSTVAPIPLPTLPPTPPSLSGISSPAPVPTSTTEATSAPLPASTVTTLAPFRLISSTSAPIPTPSSALKPSPTPTPPVGSTPAVPTSSPLGPSGSSSSTIVIATVVPTAGLLALLVLVSCRRRIQVRLDPLRSKTKPSAFIKDTDTPGSASGPVASGGGGVGEVVSGHQIILASSGAHARPGIILDTDDVQSGHGRRMTPALSQEPSATVASQSRSSIEPTVPPGYNNVTRGGMTGLPSPGARSEGSTRFDRKNWRDYAAAAGANGGAHAFGLGREIDEVCSNSNASKRGTSGAVDALLQLYASQEEDTAALGGGRRSCEAHSGDSEGALTSSDATEEYPSDAKTDQGVGMGQAIMETARELAKASMIPAVSEAAAMISVLVRLVLDNKQSDDGADGKLRWCRTMVALLGRATDLLSKDKEFPDEVEHVLLEDVRESVDNLVQLIRTYRSKNKMVRVITSSLFKRRQEELEASINSALSHLQMGLQLHGGHKLDAVGQDVRNALLVQQQRVPQGVTSESADLTRAASRRQRRRHKLEQLEIQEEELTLTDELLGRGGFGSVYIADYNGRNAAAKVLVVEHDLAGPGGSESNRDVTGGSRSYTTLGPQKNQLREFMRELDTMTRLRSSYTVNVYGAVTSRSDRLILVMELMSGGDLRTFLKAASGPIEEQRARRIVGEVCAGMAFLHDKRTIHGDLKSANVLFDGYGRAKICDFGTSRWAQHTYSSGLVTYTTKKNQHAAMSLPWTAPEVLNKGERSFKSDVYSFGMVTWEVLTRDVPWSNETEILHIYRRVVFKEERPDVPEEAPSDLADIVRACWVVEPSRRPSFQSILKEMKSNGWREA